ncbi:MAG: hypothetical protein ACXWUG_19700 [Polyangiales bacterium]
MNARHANNALALTLQLDDETKCELTGTGSDYDLYQVSPDKACPWNPTGTTLQNGTYAYGGEHRLIEMSFSTADGKCRVTDVWTEED